MYLFNHNLLFIYLNIIVIITSKIINNIKSQEILLGIFFIILSVIGVKRIINIEDIPQHSDISKDI